MSGTTWSLLVSSAAIAVIHTALGADHWLPFTMLARARRWSATRTLMVTFWCGLGHVASSLLLAIGGLTLGYGASHVAGLEMSRGDIGAWGLVAFGAAYAAWGVRRALRVRRGYLPHEHEGHVHLHARGEAHHHHAEGREGAMPAPSRATFWTLFTVFVLGPCEPLIPLFILPASRGAWWLAGWTAAVFSVITIATMMTLVALASAGAARVPLGRVERWSHALAGGVIAACGGGVLVFGL